MLTDGYPTLGRYGELTRDPLFREMKDFSDRFRAENGDALRYYSRRWVADPLHHWSRRWEYLYVTERFAESCGRRVGGTLRMLDAGSGLTFFAHWLAHRFPAVAIDCADRDPRAAASAKRLRPPAQSAVSYVTQDLANLTYGDASFDAVNCLSVLEHSRNHQGIVREFARILKPGGALVITVDVSPDGRWQVPPDRAAALIRAIEHRFEPDADYRSLLDDFDPARHLTTGHARDLDASLLPWKYPSLDNLRQNPLRPDRWFKPRFKYLTCFCTSWRRRA